MKVHVYIEKEKSSGFTMFVPKIITMFFDFLFQCEKVDTFAFDLCHRRLSPWSLPPCPPL